MSSDILVVNIPSIDGWEVVEYQGIVHAEVIKGANFIKDIFAKFTDIAGGSSSSYERVFFKAKEEAIKQLQKQAEKLGANVVLNFQFSICSVGKESTILQLSCSGTAVIMKQIS